MKQSELSSVLLSCLKELHLPTVRECYSAEADVARQESLSYEHYLLTLMEQECEVRRNSRISRFLRESQLPLEKSLASFDRRRLPQKLASQVAVLSDGSFLSRSENILAFGNPGSGKTHLLCAIGQELIHQGYRILFQSCSLLVQKLLMAKRDLCLQKLLKGLKKYDAIIIDDIGYVQQSREEMEVLFTLLAYRYERGSIMITNISHFNLFQ